jgi:hypothetical protein
VPDGSRDLEPHPDARLDRPRCGLKTRMKVMKDTPSVEQLAPENSPSPGSILVEFGCNPSKSNGSV